MHQLKCYYYKNVSFESDNNILNSHVRKIEIKFTEAYVEIPNKCHTYNTSQGSKY